MQKTKLTRRHKLLLSIRGLKPENWYLERETAELLYIVSRNGQRRHIKKTVINNK